MGPKKGKVTKKGKGTKKGKEKKKGKKIAKVAKKIEVPVEPINGRALIYKFAFDNEISFLNAIAEFDLRRITYVLFKEPLPPRPETPPEPEKKPAKPKKMKKGKGKKGKGNKGKGKKGKLKKDGIYDEGEIIEEDSSYDEEVITEIDGIFDEEDISEEYSTFDEENVVEEDGKKKGKGKKGKKKKGKKKAKKKIVVEEDVEDVLEAEDEVDNIIVHNLGKMQLFPFSVDINYVTVDVHDFKILKEPPFLIETLPTFLKWGYPYRLTGYQECTDLKRFGVLMDHGNSFTTTEQELLGNKGPPPEPQPPKKLEKKKGKGKGKGKAIDKAKGKKKK